ncbi:TIM barrel protein [Sinorhizobium meliloti]|uniref:TIM barrel protein n=1 Tax=Rhizobium meliloti TaxID=382 RepID=UPI003F73954C
MSIKIAINPITWTNDDVPELGGDTSLEQCLSEMRQAGYAGTELGGKYPRQGAALKRVLDLYGLELASGWWDGRLYERDVDAEFEAILAHLTLLRDLGAKHVVYADTSMGRHDGIRQPISKRPRLRGEEWEEYGRKLTDLAERMAEFGVGLAFHHHMGTIVETDEDVDRLMSVTGERVGLLFDSGHSAFSGGILWLCVSAMPNASSTCTVRMCAVMFCARPEKGTSASWTPFLRASLPFPATEVSIFPRSLKPSPKPAIAAGSSYKQSRIQIRPTR